MLVGNVNELGCHHLCRDVDILVQGKAFMVDLHVLPLCGVDVVLGVQWLKSLGPVLTDYNTLSMKFVYQGSLIELKGNSDSFLLAITTPQLRRLTQTHSAVEYFHIRVYDQASSSSMPHPDIHALTTQFSSLFQPPTTLPLFHLPATLTTLSTFHPTLFRLMFVLICILIFINKRLKLKLPTCFNMALSDPAPAPAPFLLLCYWSKNEMEPGPSAWTTEH